MAEGSFHTNTRGEAGELFVMRIWHVLNRFITGRASRPRCRAVDVFARARLEALEPRLLLTAAPTFVTPLEDQVLTVHNALTIGVDAQDADGDPVTVSAVSSDPGIDVFIPAGNQYALLNFNDHLGNPLGTMVMEVFEDRAADAAARFIDLSTMDFDANGDPIPAVNPYYTNVPVHRVAELGGTGNGGFIIQTGDGENGNGTGGSTLGEHPDQFNRQNGVSFAGKLVVATANSGPDTQDAQIFVTNDPVTHLNDRHMIVGHVVAGQSVVDAIIALPRDGSDKPINTPVLASVDIVTNTQDATITFSSVDGFVGEATVTVTLDDGQNQTQQVINVGVLGFDDADFTIDPGQSTSFFTNAHGNSAETQTVNVSQAPDGPTVDYNAGTRQVDIDVPVDYSGIVAVELNAVQDNQPLLPANHTVFVKAEAPNTPVPIVGRAATNLTGSAQAQRIDGDRMYVANGARGVEVFDVSDPANPQFLGGFITGGDSQDIELVDYTSPARKVAFVADGNGGLLVLDVSDPANITQLHRVKVSGQDPAALQDTAFDVEIDQTNMIAWVADGSEGLASFDVSDPLNIPDKLDELGLTSGGTPLDLRALALDGDFAYGSVLNFGLVVYRTADPADIDFDAGASLPLATPWGIQRDGDVLYVVEVGSGGAGSALTVFDVSNRAAPAQLGTLPLSDTPWRVAASGPTAVVGHLDGGFTFVDVSDPANPNTLHVLDAPPGVAPAIFGEELFALPIQEHGVLLVDGDALTGPSIVVLDDGGAPIASSQDLADAIGFGSVLFGQPGIEMSFTVRNDGADTLNVGVINLPAGYSLTADLADRSLQPDEAQTFTVRLDAAGDGTKEGVMTIASDDPDQDPFNVPVTGQVTTRQLLGPIAANAPLAPFVINGVTTALRWRGDGQANVFQLVDDSIEIEATGTALNTQLAAKSSGGDGIVHVNLIDTDGSFGKLDFRGATLTGDVRIDETAKLIQFGAVADEHEINLGAAPSGGTVTLELGRVAELTIRTLTAIKTLTVTEWLDTDGNADVIHGTWIGKIIVKGAQGIPGHFMAGLDLSGAGAPGRTLGSVKIPGRASDAVWDIIGDVGPVKSGDLQDVHFQVASLFHSLKAAVLTNVDFDVDDAGKLKIGAWNGGTFNGRSLKKLIAKLGDVSGVDITLTGSANPAVKATFGGAKVAHDLTNGTLTVTGDGGMVKANSVSNWTANFTGNLSGVKTVGLIVSSLIAADGSINLIKGAGLHSSQVYAGLAALPAGQVLPDTSTAAGFAAPSTIRTVKLKNTTGAPTFMDSAVAAMTITKALLGVVDLSNGGTVHGLAADLIKTLSAVDTSGQRLNLKRLDDPAALATLLTDAGIDLVDMEIRLVA